MYTFSSLQQIIQSPSNTYCNSTFLEKREGVKVSFTRLKYEELLQTSNGNYKVTETARQLKSGLIFQEENITFWEIKKRSAFLTVLRKFIYLYTYIYIYIYIFINLSNSKQQVCQDSSQLSVQQWRLRGGNTFTPIRTAAWF